LTMIDNRCYQKCQQITAVKQYLLTKVTAWRTPMQVTSIQLLYILHSNTKVTAWRTPMLVTSIQLTVYTVFHRQGNGVAYTDAGNFDSTNCFTACMTLLMATSAFWLKRRC